MSNWNESFVQARLTVSVFETVLVCVCLWFSYTHTQVSYLWEGPNFHVYHTLQTNWPIRKLITLP